MSYNYPNNNYSQYPNPISGAPNSLYPNLNPGYSNSNPPSYPGAGNQPVYPNQVPNQPYSVSNPYGPTGNYQSYPNMNHAPYGASIPPHQQPPQYGFNNNPYPNQFPGAYGQGYSAGAPGAYQSVNNFQQSQLDAIRKFDRDGRVLISNLL